MTNKYLQVLIGALATVLLASTASANLLDNASFEDPDTPFGASGGTCCAPEYPGATGWTVFGDGVFTIEDFVGAIPAHDGNQVLKMFGFSGAFQEFAATAGETWTASAWAYNDLNDAMGPDQVAAVNIEWINAAGDNIGTIFGGSFDGTAEVNVWTLLTAVGVAPTNVAFARIVLITGPFGPGGQGGGAPKFDDASFTVQAVPLPAAAWLFGSALLGLAGLRRRG